VGWFAYITDNYNLANLDGLSSLVSVGMSLYITDNYNLTNLDGLSSLTSVGEDLYIYANSNLTNLDGLFSLTSVGIGLSIAENYNLSEFCGLYTLLNGGGFTGGYSVCGNAVNPTQQEIIDGGPCPLICVGDIILSSQEEVDALFCSSISGNLTISGAEITDLSSLLMLTSVGGDLIILPGFHQQL